MQGHGWLAWQGHDMYKLAICGIDEVRSSVGFAQ